eukprot:TRINITY_DN120139_c0_g1_i1.p3 TRINITY_DN120139_c0_g1~~TRINITY_DN120139_c0_g1_i1.p3  ORF type:complete len:231 (-),score=20.31 TRINITY_DN120139_c0_g1_i1:1581-2273(-)
MQLYPYLTSGLFSDVTLRIVSSTGNSHDFKAHKMLLANKSRYFSVLFTRGFKEQFESVVNLPDFFDPLGFEVLLQYLYGVALDFPSLGLLPKVLEMADYLDLPKGVETGLIILLYGRVKIAEVRELILLYGELKEMVNRAEQFESQGQLKELYREVLRGVEETICLNIKEVISQNTVNLLSPELAMSLLETALSYVCENSTLYAVLEEIRIRMRSPSFFQMLAFVLAFVL